MTIQEKVASFVGDAARWVRSGFSVADNKTIEMRLKTCEVCPYWDETGFRGTGKCTVCGCSTRAKLVLATSKCPDGKW